ncbi:MAG: hypothetical protein K2I06_11285 [Ruminococcus sp.]|nr:hypothetical protein [Ruminococcus sp.]
MQPEIKPIVQPQPQRQTERSVQPEIKPTVQPQPQEQAEQPNTAVIFGNTAYSKIPDKKVITNIDPLLSVNLFNRLQQNNISFSCKLSENALTVVCSKDDLQKVQSIIREEAELLVQKPKTELVSSAEKQVPKEQQAPEIKAESKPVITEPVSEKDLSAMSSTEKTNALISSLKDRQEKKRADLLDKIDSIESKIMNRKERINKLNDKISDIETSLKTAAAFKRVFGNTALGGLVDRSIAKKQAKIEEIRNVKIPKHEEKIKAQTEKKTKVTGRLAKVNRKIERLDKVQDFISSIGSKDKEQRHKGFVTGLESLSDIRRENLENKLNKNQTKIDMLSARLSSPELSNMDRLNLSREIRTLKNKSADISEKIKGLDKLHSDLDDMKNGRYTETEIETAVNRTTDKISERYDGTASPEDKGITNHIILQTIESGSEAVSEVSAEKSAIQTEKTKPDLDRERVPEERESEVTVNAEQQILTSVAAITGVAISELNRLPVELKADIIAEFRENNGNIPTEKLAEVICEAIDIKPPVQEQKQPERNTPERENKADNSRKVFEENSKNNSLLNDRKEKQTEKELNKPLFSRSAIMSDKYKPTSSKSAEDIERDRQNRNMGNAL